VISIYNTLWQVPITFDNNEKWAGFVVVSAANGIAIGYFEPKSSALP